jgi:hypothetical protein
MAVVGTARLAGTTVCSPDTSWRHHHRDFGLSRDEYDAYLDGAANAYLLHLTAVNRLTKPLPLRHLREQTPFQPRRACATSLLRTRPPALVDALRSAGLAREGEAAMVWGLGLARRHQFHRFVDRSARRSGRVEGVTGQG